MNVAQGSRARCVLGAFLLTTAACGPVVAIDDEDAAGSTSSPEPEPPSPPPSTTASTTGSPDEPATTDTGEDPCAQLGACPLCHDGFLLEFFAVGGLEARALVPTQDGGLVAVGTTDAPGAITWLDAHGEPVAHAGPYAEGLELRSATWGPDGGLILAGNIGDMLWVGLTDASGALLLTPSEEDADLLSNYSFMPDIRVTQHDVRGFFVSAHLSHAPPTAHHSTVFQFNHQVQWRHMIMAFVEHFALDLVTRGSSAVTSTDMLYALSNAETGLHLFRRSTETPWNVVEPDIVVVEVPGLPADITALHGDSVVTLSNDEEAHLARVDDGEDVVWLRTVSMGPHTRAERVGFDPVHDLIFVAGSVGAEDDPHLWLAAFDEDGGDVWQWTAPAELEDARTPALDVVGLPAGGAAVSTAGALWYAIVRPDAC